MGREFLRQDYGVCGKEIQAGQCLKTQGRIVQKIQRVVFKWAGVIYTKSGGLLTEFGGLRSGGYGREIILHKTPEIQMVEPRRCGVSRPKRREFPEWKSYPWLGAISWCSLNLQRQGQQDPRQLGPQNPRSYSSRQRCPWRSWRYRRRHGS